MFLASRLSNHRLVVGTWKLVATLQEAVDHLKSLGTPTNGSCRIYKADLNETPVMVKYAEWSPLV